MDELEALIPELVTTRNELWQAVADGTLSEPLVKRFCKEYYFLGKWYTAEFGSLVSNAPDIDALSLDQSEHFIHWCQNLADETGFAGDRNHVDMGPRSSIPQAHEGIVGPVRLPRRVRPRAP